MTPVIEVDDLQKVYVSRTGDRIRALDGVTFQVPQGHISGLLGPNGAGKSTVVKILGTITSPTAGRAAVRGFDVSRQPLDVRRQMAVVLQQTAAENLLTVQDNLLIYAYLHGVEARAAKQRLNAVAEEFEIGERMHDAVQDLSLGTKRRIQVAKIFMLDTPLIILDEATTGMDPMMKRLVMDRLRAEARDLLPLTAVVVMATTACWFFLFSIFAISLRRMDAFNTVTSAAYILLMFFSTMFYPISDLPAWFRWAAYLNPMTWQVDLLRFSLLGVGAPFALLLEAAALVVFAVICLAFAARALNRAD